MENNKLIADFMGCTHPFNEIHDATLYKLVHFSRNLICPTTGIAYPKVEQGVFELDELEYHTSWDWLMPVAEKCLTTDEPSDGQHYFINDALLTCNIEVVYDRVVEFIKTYNDGEQ